MVTAGLVVTEDLVVATEGLLVTMDVLAVVAAILNPNLLVSFLQHNSSPHHLIIQDEFNFKIIDPDGFINKSLVGLRAKSAGAE